MRYFEETQRFTQWWVWTLMAATNLLIIGIFSNAFYVQFYLGVPWGTKPTSDTALLIIALLSIAVLAACNIMLFMSKLEMKADGRFIQYRYFPYIRTWKKIKKSEIKEAYIRKYAPITEYGGWGCRVWFREENQALTSHGNMGLQLVFNDNKKLLIGTQRPKELEQVMQEFMTEYNEQDYG